MSTDQNKSTARRISEEVWNKGNLKALDEIFAPGAPTHDPNTPIAPGPEGFRQVVSLYRSAFPDLRFTIEQEIAEGWTVFDQLGLLQQLGVVPTSEQMAAARH